MSKKSDQRRQKRKRQAKAERDDRRRELNRRVEQTVEALGAACLGLAASAGDGGVPPEEFAEEAARLLTDERWHVVLSGVEPVIEVAEEIAQVIDGDRAAALADALVGSDGEEPLRARLSWLAVGLADRADRRELLERVGTAALERTAAPDDALIANVVARARIEVGRLGDGLEVLEERCAAVPGDDDLQATRAWAMARAVRLREGDGVDTLDLGPQAPVSADQLARALAVADRYRDRSVLHRLWEAAAAHLAADPDLAAWHERQVAEELAAAREAGGLGPFDELGGGPLRPPPAEPGAPGPEPVSRLLAERAWLTGPDDDLDEDEELAMGDTVLGRVADDPTTPPEVAAAARSWYRHVRYGLWQPQLPAPGADGGPDMPGVWLTDLATYSSIYADLPFEQLEGLPRWSVLAGPIGPVGGVWRSGSAMLVLAPDLADRAVESVLTVTDLVVGALAREHGMRAPRPERRGGGHPEPHGVLADLSDPLDPGHADLANKVLGGSLANLIGMVEGASRAPVGMANTDGDPLELLTAAFPCVDPLAVRSRLLSGPDFEAGEDEERGRGELAPPLRWWGREMSPSQAASALAMLQAQLREEGLEPIEASDGPQRWLGGTLRFEVGRVLVDVNSRIRLEAVTAELRRASVTAAPEVTAQVDPRMDLPAPGRHLGGSFADPAAEEAWRSTWVDEAVPALGGATPRRAARSEGSRVLLESLLRTFEHDADVAAAAGRRPMDVDALRKALGMEQGVYGPLPGAIERAR